MSPLFTTVDGWVSTMRSIRWSPLVAAPVAAAVAVLVAGTFADGDTVKVGLVAETGLAFTAVMAAFIADDPTTEAAPGTPVEAPARLAVRAGLMVPVAVAGWLSVLAVYACVTPGLAVDLGERALAGSGISSAALAVAALATKVRSVVSPGAAAAGVMAAFGLSLQVVPVRWLEHLPSGRVLWPVTILVGLLVVVAAAKEPPSS